MSKNLTFMKVTTTKSLDSVKAHCKYIGFRSRENHQNDRGLFSRDQEIGASYHQFVDELRRKPSLNHSQTNKAFKVVLSWREQDAKELGIHAEEKYKEIARNYVAMIEQDKNMKLNYIGAVHMKDGHPHIHLVISGVGSDKETGNDRRLKVNFKEDVPKYKDSIDKNIGANRLIQERQLDERLRGQDKKQPNQSRYITSKDVTKDVFKQLERLGKEARYKAEQARQQQEKEVTKNHRDEDRGRERER
ncbi:relaxase/mobilization nuclease domain-containing protein [Staphylococcus pseudintermedius]|uniref:relaxase/mobilization nuclease domain-containing protein n=1 Tax=Staphylococcus pseudintermedius TaxID=283734 RepID=UPI000BBB7B3B|nr:hypothetical protein [Staphylococcus pseudintermedius]PCE48130.1 hypothetical protein BSR34_11815 [Staphylococcus pseudintermedius]